MECWQAVWEKSFPADGCKYAKKPTVLLIAAYVAAKDAAGNPAQLSDVVTAVGMNRQTVQHVLNYLTRMSVIRKTANAEYVWKSHSTENVPATKTRRRPLNFQ